MTGGGPHPSVMKTDSMKKPDGDGSPCGKEALVGSDLWVDGLICAFELVRSGRKTVRSKSCSKTLRVGQVDVENLKKQVPAFEVTKAIATNSKVSNLLDSSRFIEQGHKDSQANESCCFYNKWVPIGWTRISELVQLVQPNLSWGSQQFEFLDDEDDLTVADVAAPYWEQPAGPTWWCHVSAGHPFINTWLSNAQWLHPAISVALRDESRLISDRMKHLLYEVPVRVAGGLLFELLGQSVGDPFIDEDDIPVVLRSWQAQNFLLTALHVKGSAPKINVLGIIEVQELLCGGGYNVPRTIHELIALIAFRLSRWDDRLFRKHIFGEADEIELKFMNRRNHEDMNLFTVILNQEIRRLSRQMAGYKIK